MIGRNEDEFLSEVPICNKVWEVLFLPIVTQMDCVVKVWHHHDGHVSIGSSKTNVVADTKEAQNMLE